MSSFKKSHSWSVETLPMTRYYSKQHGTTVVFAKSKSKMVYGTIAFATKSYNDHGAPHALEHLVFMGSEQYPYKGVLDHMAHQSFSQGTNAWTATDHTAYTWDCATSEGCLRLFPVFLDNVLSPKLTKASCWSEVYHVNSEGKEGGVVFSEMQAREKTQSDRIFLEFGRTVFGSESCYSSETGGTLSGIRKITHQELVDFHKEHYKLDNMTVLIVGDIDEKAVLSLIDDYGEKNPRPKMQHKVWDIKNVPCEINKKFEVKTVTYPSTNDKLGAILIAYKGPEWGDFNAKHTYSLFGNYLTNDPTSPCSTQLVNKGFCSNVYCSVLEYRQTVIYFYIDNVPINKMEQIPSELDKIIKQPVDIDRMKRLITLSSVQYKNKIEKEPETINSTVIEHSLYDGNNCTLPTSISPIPYWTKLGQMPVNYWDTIKASLSNPICVILGLPENENQTDETLRTPIPRPDDGLSENIPRSFWKKYKLLKSPVLPTIKSNKGKILTVNTTSGFNTHTMSLSTIGISDGLRMYLPLFSECMFELPTATQTVKKFIQEIKDETVNYGTSLGLGSIMTTHMFVTILTEKDKSEMAEKWFDLTLRKSIFDKKRVKIIALRLLKQLNDYNDNGSLVCRSILNRLTYKSTCNINISNFSRQQEFLQIILNNIEKTVKKLDIIRDILLNQVHFFISGHESSNISHKLVWNTSNFVKPIPLSEMRSIQNFQRIDKPLVATDSCFIMINTPGPTERNAKVHAALSVATKYLTMQEGPLWNGIRGPGLAYSYSLSSSIETGMTTYMLYRATRDEDALEESRQIIGHIPKSISEIAINEAKSNIIVSIIDSVATESQQASQQFQNYMRDVPSSWLNEYMSAIQNVTLGEIRNAWKQFILPIFDSDKSNMVVVKNI